MGSTGNEFADKLLSGLQPRCQTCKMAGSIALELSELVSRGKLESKATARQFDTILANKCVRIVIPDESSIQPIPIQDLCHLEERGETVESVVKDIRFFDEMRG